MSRGDGFGIAQGACRALSCGLLLESLRARLFGMLACTCFRKQMLLHLHAAAQGGDGSYLRLRTCGGGCTVCLGKARRLLRGMGMHAFHACECTLCSGTLLCC